jgi:hypothetical protein
LRSLRLSTHQTVAPREISPHWLVPFSSLPSVPLPTDLQRALSLCVQRRGRPPRLFVTCGSKDSASMRVRVIGGELEVARKEGGVVEGQIASWDQVGVITGAKRTARSAEAETTYRRRPTYHAMVNRTTNQIVRIEIVKAGDPDSKRLGYKLDRWIDLGGLKLATVYQNIGLADEVVTFTSVSADPEADETLYVPLVVP